MPKLNHQKEIVSNYPEFYSTQLKSYVENIPKFENKRLLLISEIETKARGKLNVDSKQGEIAILKRDIQQLQSQIESEQRSIKIKEPELEKAKEILELYLKIKKETRDYVNVFHSELAKEIVGTFEPIQEIVKSVIDEYLYVDDRPAKLIFEMKPENWDEETGEVISEIITAYIEPLDKSYGAQPVNKYFNSFHYRLFCTMIGIGIAIASRKNTGVNLPLVLDDIFYASDFENRVTIEGFISKLFSLFKKFTPEKELQLILFTHDQLIFESIMSTSVANDNKIIFAKMFGYEEAIIETDYRNLIYRLSVFTPYFETQNS
jgi:hypothetical protein